MSAVAAPLRRRLMPRVHAPRLATLSVIVIAVVVVVALAAPLLAPHDPNVGDLRNTLAGTSGDHLLGTDANGRDILSRLIYGARNALFGPLVVVVLSAAVGVPLGLIAGYRAGLVDGVIARAWDVLLSFPPLLLAILIVATFGTGFWNAALAVALFSVPIIGRLTRGAVIVERNKPYVDACRVQGYSGMRTVCLHILPNILPLIIVQVTLGFGYALLDLAALAFLGLGAQPPTADWGQMLTAGRDSLVLGSSIEVVAASVAILVTVLAFNIVGDHLAAKAEGIA